MFQSQCLWHSTLQNKCYNRLVINELAYEKINEKRLELKPFDNILLEFKVE